MLTILQMCPVEGPLSIEETLHGDHNGAVVAGRHRVKLSDALGFINDLGSHIMETLARLPSDQIINLSSVAQLFAVLIDGLTNVVAERDAANEASLQRLPAVTPSELVKLRRSQFGGMIIQMKARLQRSGISAVKIQEIEDNFSDLLNAYQKEPHTKAAVDACTTSSSFEDCWKSFAGRIEALKNFCGGVATVFPNTARVEADFSTIKREKNPLRMSLSDFSLEGILQAEQFALLQSL
jgi:hypothetical protein